MKNKKNVITFNKQIGDMVSKLYFYLVLILLPLYMNKQMYLALIGAKGSCFTFIASLVFIAIFVYYMQGIISDEYKFQFSFANFKVMDYILIAFGASLTISFYLSEDRKQCFWGTNGFRVGYFLIFSSLLFCFYLSRNLMENHKVWDMVMIITDIIYLWIIVNAFSVDILGMHAMIDVNQYFFYFASLGNSNSISGYICLLLPVTIIFYLHETNKQYRMFYLTNICLGVLSSFSIHADGIFLGFAFMFIFLLPYAFAKVERFMKLCEIAVVCGIGLILLKLFMLLLPDKILVANDVAQKMLDLWVGIPLAIIGALGVFICSKVGQKIKDSVLHVIGYVISCLISVGVVGFAALIIKNLTPEYGSGRGAIWMGAVEMFKCHTVQEKLFGLGPDMLKAYLTEFVAEAGGNMGVNYANTHNNILECLLCLGIIGLIIYMAFWIYTTICYIKNGNKNWSIERVACYLALISYFGQGLVSNPYSLNIPILFVLLGMYRNAMWLEDHTVISNTSTKQNRKQNKKRKK